MYKSCDDWLYEIENFGTRYERMVLDTDHIDKWVRTAWRLGYESAQDEILDLKEAILKLHDQLDACEERKVK